MQSLRTACATHELHAFEHVSTGSSSLFLGWQHSVEAADLVVLGHFPSMDPRERRRGVVGRSNISPADCVMDEDDGCTTPTVVSRTS